MHLGRARSEKSKTRSRKQKMARVVLFAWQERRTAIFGWLYFCNKNKVWRPLHSIQSTANLPCNLQEEDLIIISLYGARRIVLFTRQFFGWLEFSIKLKWNKKSLDTAPFSTVTWPFIGRSSHSSRERITTKVVTPKTKQYCSVLTFTKSILSQAGDPESHKVIAPQCARPFQFSTHKIF